MWTSGRYEVGVQGRLVRPGIVVVLWAEIMEELFWGCWAWLADENNRGRVGTIALVAGTTTALLTLIINSIKRNRKAPPPPGGEVLLSPEDFLALLKKRERGQTPTVRY